MNKREHDEHEALCRSLDDDATRAEYKKAGDDCRPGFLPRLLGGWLVWCGNVVYGKEPSLLKFRAVEVIARVPYQSWSSAVYTLLTLCYRDEKKAMELSRVARFARLSHDNETMHVVVISQLAKGERAGYFRHTFIPMVFAFFYFWWSYWLYLLNPRYAHELNYLFEEHAFEQYRRFLEEKKVELRGKTIDSDFLKWYGRHADDQYNFFLSVQNDEIIHRNKSAEEARKTNTP